MVEAAVARWGKLDILQNNVGIGGSGRVPDVDRGAVGARAARQRHIDDAGGETRHPGDDRRWRRLDREHLVDRARCGRADSRPTLRRRAQSKPSRAAWPQTTRRDGIRVNCIEPGPVYTPMVYAAGMRDDVRELRRRASPLGIEGSGWDIGYASLFLASDEARYITGVVLPVDGGVLLGATAERSVHEGAKYNRPEGA